MGLISNSLSAITGAVTNAAKSEANKLISQGVNSALNQVPGQFRGIASSILNGALGSFGFGASSYTYEPYEDFDKLRRINKQLVQTEFIYDWNYRVEIEGAPDDFEFYVKDVTYGLGEYDTEEQNYGAASYCWPTVDKILRFTCTLRDNIDMRNYYFLAGWYSLIFNNDGTVRTPSAQTAM